MAIPMIQKGLIIAISEAPTFERPAYVIYPSNPIHPDVQAVALDGLRLMAAKLKTND
jgi:hypothetical protein